MTVFQHMFWGYEITFPDSWFRQQVQDTDILLANIDGLDPFYDGPDAGQVHIRGEWNWERQKVEPLWNQHIGMVAGMLGAKNVGAAPWRMRDAVGMEAEIVLPEKANRRLWTGILMRDYRVLHFMVTHPKQVRVQFEPVATQIIKSLRFPPQVEGVEATPDDIPLPPNFRATPPQKVVDDISDLQLWRAYIGNAGTGELQSFYLRELPARRWVIEEYLPFPGSSDLGFARFKLRRDQRQVLLGIMPSRRVDAVNAADVVYKISDL